MKKRTKIVISTLACMVSICLLLFGVYASVNPSVTLNGQVSYSVRDASVYVQGKVISSGYDVNFDQVPATKDALLALQDVAKKNQGLDYLDWTHGEVSTAGMDESAIPSNEKLAGWTIENVNFEEDSNGVKDIFVIFQVTNYSNYPVKVNLSFVKTEDQLLEANIIRVVSKNNFVLAENQSTTGKTQKVKIRYTVNDDSKSVTNVDIGMTLQVSKEEIAKTNLEMFDITYCTEASKTGLTSYYTFEINDKATGTVVYPATYTDGTNPVAPVVPARTKYVNECTSNADWLGYFMSNTNTSITKVYVSEGISEIGDCAFAGFEETTEIVLPTTVTYIGGGAIAYCSALKNINIPDAVKTMASISVGNSFSSPIIGVFDFSMALEGIYLPENVQWIESLANYCSSLKFLAVDRKNQYFKDYDSNVIVLVDYFDKDNEEAGYNGEISLFNGCAYTRFDKLENVHIDQIGSWAFMGMTELKSAIIPNSVTYVYAYAFGDCASLEEIVIGESVNYISGSAFAGFVIGGCSSLKKVYLKSEKQSQTFSTTAMFQSYAKGDVLYIASNIDDSKLHSTITSNFEKGNLITYKGTQYYAWTMTSDSIA